MKTTAQKVYEAFQSQTKTVSVKTLSLPRKGVRSKVGDEVCWTFPDGSVIRSLGRGRSHKLTVE